MFYAINNDHLEENILKDGSEVPGPRLGSIKVERKLLLFELQGNTTINGVLFNCFITEQGKVDR